MLGLSRIRLGKAQHLDGQHRKHAGHQVEQKAAHQRPQNGQRQAQGGGVGCRWFLRCACVLSQRLRQSGRDLDRGGLSQCRPSALHGRFKLKSRGLGCRLRPRRDHPAHGLRAVAAFFRDRNLGLPDRALPVLRPVFVLHGRVVHHAGGDWESAERLASPTGGQAVHAQAQLLAIVRQRGLAAGDPSAALLELRHRLGAEFLGRFEACRVRRLRRGRGQVQAHAAFLRNAFLAAHQPIGL